MASKIKSAKTAKPAKPKKAAKAPEAAALKPPRGWKRWDGRDAIWKTYVFDDFVQAFGFMTSAALVAESMDHHPEWSNVYATVEVTLTTHDAGGVTERDIALAEAMDRIAGKAGKKARKKA